MKHFERCSVVNGWSKEKAAVFLAARLRGEAQKVLNGMSDSDCRNYANWSFGLVLKNSASYTRPVCTTVANRKIKVFKPFLQISGLCQLSLIRIFPLTLRTDLQSNILLTLSKDRDDRPRLRRDKQRTMDEALWLASELETFRLLDRDRARSSPKVCYIDEVQSEPDLVQVQFEMLRSDLQAQQQRQETQQVVLQQLVQQIQ